MTSNEEGRPAEGALPDQHTPGTARSGSENDSTYRRLSWNGHPQLTAEYHRRRDAVAGRRVPPPPPHAPETELALIGALVVFADRTLDEVLATGITPEHFYCPAPRRAFEAVLAQHEAGEPVDEHTVAARLGERSTVAEAVCATGGAMPAHAPAWARLIIDHAKCRAMLPPLRAAIRAAQNGDAVAVFELMNATLDAGEVPDHACR